MKLYQTLAFAAIVGLSATKPVPFDEDALVLRADQELDAVTAPEKRDPLAHAIEDLTERSADAEPVDLSNVDTVIVARTPEAEPEAEPEWKDVVERSPQAKGKKGKGKGKGGKGKGKGKDGKGKGGKGKGAGGAGKGKKGKRRTT
ncbi:hypothetical protein BU26DRAFT_600315 [Trematosphaeria pertusa]|uniref:Uncharacterized protein n=1 Tax=Trematosphaeria pertusa TaxID=390896 RepID=A0A6A6IW39_9PLEO|nr:uncharacterized protein BU26DRAFT_600315 [Trematosphaeria pertusa]KAF2254659.1 hypothetical protein BU26DRAFT_600315 [Trematosphaeria pertusa]